MSPHVKMPSLSLLFKISYVIFFMRFQTAIKLIFQKALGKLPHVKNFKKLRLVDITSLHGLVIIVPVPKNALGTNLECIYHQR